MLHNTIILMMQGRSIQLIIFVVEDSIDRFLFGRIGLCDEGMKWGTIMGHQRSQMWGFMVEHARRNRKEGGAQDGINGLMLIWLP